MWEEAPCSWARRAYFSCRYCRLDLDEEDCRDELVAYEKREVEVCETKWDENSYWDGYFEPVKNILMQAINLWTNVILMGSGRPEIDLWIILKDSEIMEAFEGISETLVEFRQATADHDYWKTGGHNIYPEPTKEYLEANCGDLIPGHARQIYQDPNMIRMDREFHGLHDPSKFATLRRGVLEPLKYTDFNNEATCVGDAGIALEMILKQLDESYDDLQTIISESWKKMEQGINQAAAEAAREALGRLAEELCPNMFCLAPQCYEERTCHMGVCSTPIAKASGAFCDDGDSDTTLDRCDGSGGCIGVTPCGSHEDCPDSRPFCKSGSDGFYCDICDECHSCSDGIDGTCGSCGNGYPTLGDSCGDIALECIPDTEAKCRSVAAAQGFSDGGQNYPFVGSWSNMPKGCYAYSSGTYSGLAFFNTAGYGSATGLAITQTDVHRLVDLNCGSHAETGCTPHTESACREAAIAEGLELGSANYNFVGSWSNRPKGCYVYTSGTHIGQAYFNTGGFGDGTDVLPYNSGTETQKQASQNLVRVPNFNCCQKDNANDCFQDGVEQGFENGGSGRWENTPRGCYVYWDGSYEGKVYYNQGGQGSAFDGLLHAPESQHRIAQWTC